jgi:hypothetical protein
MNRTRAASRRYRTAHKLERRTAPADQHAPSPDGAAGERDPHADMGARTYEMSYSVSLGYTAERTILLP